MNAMQFCLHYLGVIRQRVSCSVKKKEKNRTGRCCGVRFLSSDIGL